MGNDNQFVEQPVPAFVPPTTTSSSPPPPASKDGIVALQTPVEPIDSRQTLLNEQKFSTKIPRVSSPSVITADKIFAIALFILLVVLISYIIFHGKVTDMKLSRLPSNTDLKSNDIRVLLEEMDRTLKSIERLLIEQTKKTNVNIQLNGQDVRDYSKNQTVLTDFLRRIKERL